MVDFCHFRLFYSSYLVRTHSNTCVISLNRVTSPYSTSGKNFMTIGESQISPIFGTSAKGRR
jgi:hypothetical protein